eukprot:GFUD01022013.1.p1 GENE.GFUD01022013.1~~GFUD01022013.1.p1  ORF type:complete len:380 (-),score=132.46 GFUD01022013.1:271-1410(-)
MVYISRALLLPKKSSQQWIDSLRIYTRGGHGGTGLPRVNGVGGAGGNVYIKAVERVVDLSEVRHKNSKQRYVAGAGENSVKHKCMGSPGDDVVIRSPVGVSVVTDQGEVIGDLLKEEDLVLVARGGPGGSKATEYLGLKGQARSVKLDLKLIADVGFVGFPNAGKSTLLKAISRARPKIASYPFTTIQPNLGICEFKDLRRIELADLPGLIEGASYNVGMGHKFLKHVERTRLLLFVVDVNGFQFKLDSPHRSALDTVLLLNRELELYKEELVTKPAVLVITKMDSKGSEEQFKTFKSEYEKVVENIQTSGLPADSLPDLLCQFDEIIPISAKFSPKSVEFLKHRLRHWMDVAETRKTEENVDQLSSKMAAEQLQEIVY